MDDRWNRVNLAHLQPQVDKIHKLAEELNTSLELMLDAVREFIRQADAMLEQQDEMEQAPSVHKDSARSNWPWDSVDNG